MNTRRALPALAALLTLSSCGIPATGVVEAGGPASGIAPVTAVYYVQGDTLVPLMRPTEYPGTPEEALALLLYTPPPGEKGLTTQVKAPPATGSAAPAPDASMAPPTPSVSEREGDLTVRLPDRMRQLTDLAIDQVICTVAAARRVAAPYLDVVTVHLVAGDARFAERTDERCPQP
ncbi:hypothetical protein [Streptomyces sp. 4F14]|uniref:hypothetical protein n=1 Tax=Streptomyces sp. 4F14 TaxID=3394380 RepID=UPI003A86EDF9